jgi:hypothetical protein
MGYFPPAYHHIHQIFVPTLDDVAPRFWLTPEVNLSRKEVVLLDQRGRARAKIFCRSLDDPSAIVGFNIGHALIDELDILPTEKARLAWRKILARMRAHGARNSVSVTTTPEGFKFVHEQFVQSIQDNPPLRSLYRLIQASTRDNARNLDAGYIASLEASYPSSLVAAYLDGQFVNLAQGSVYPAYDRVRCGTTETIRPGEPLHIGMDFNVLHMAAVVHVEREGEPRAVAELMGVRDTPAIVEAIKRRWPGHPVTVYPDASGGSTSSKSASLSDLSILRAAGLHVSAPSANPAIKDRVASLSLMLERGRYRVNADTCPRLAEALERQAYTDKGEPDKSAGFDHAVDAAGYYVHHRWPVIGRGALKVRLGGV